MALRGDDIVGVTRDSDERVQFLKGEAKSRNTLSSDVVREAADSLDRDMGRPSRHSVLFTASRLHDEDKDDLALEIEKAVLQSFDGHKVEHMLFVVSGNDPEHFLANHLTGIGGEKPKRYAIGFRIPDHGDFIEGIYGGF